MTGDDLARRLGIDPDAPASDLTAADVLGALALLLDGVAPDATAPAPSRKYTYDEARLRLHTGRDPLALSPDERDAAETGAVSKRTIVRLVSRGHLERVLVASTPRITEVGIRTYERKLAEGRFRRPAQRRGGRTGSQ